jgi:hypothetical protein
MELTRLTVTDEQRKSVALEYCQAINNGSKTSRSTSMFAFFASDALESLVFRAGAADAVLRAQQLPQPLM